MLNKIVPNRIVWELKNAVVYWVFSVKIHVQADLANAGNSDF